MSENPRYKDNLIVNLTFEFSLKIIEFSGTLNGLKKYNLSNQLFRSGTSIGVMSKKLRMQKVKQTLFIK